MVVLVAALIPAVLANVVPTCPAFTAFQPVCGNGVLDLGSNEQCECPSGGTSCTCCNNCQLVGECMPGECCDGATCI